MNKSLYYCMSNTQLRKIIFACGKSQQAKNKAAAVLRLRNKHTAKQQVSLSGFSITFGLEKFILIPNMLTQKIAKKTKGNLKQGTQQITRSLNFSNIVIESAGSLSLQGRTPFQHYRTIDFTKGKYNKGVRRNKKITRPRQRIEVSEDVPSSIIEQPAKLEENKEYKQDVNLQATKICEGAQSCRLNFKQDINLQATKICEGAQSCGLNLERAVDPKPVSATIVKTIARFIMIGVTGLICLPLILTAILVLLPIIIKCLIVLIRICLAITILVSPFVIVWYVLRSCYNCCRKRTYQEELEYQRQQIMKNWKPRTAIDRFGNMVNF